MSKRFQNWSAKWQGFSPRERILLLFTAVVAPVVLIFIFLLEPALITLQKTPAKIESLQTEINSQQRVLDLLRGQQAKDPNVAARAELKKLRTQLSDVNNEIRRAATNLVTPDQMLSMLHSVLADDQGIKLVSAKSLGVEPMQLGEPVDEEGTEATVETAQAVVYVHPFELQLAGTYQGLYNYLQKIEQLEGVFFWDLLEYEVDSHPEAVIRIKVHTLSSEEGWLGA